MLHGSKLASIARRIRGRTNREGSTCFLSFVRKEKGMDREGRERDFLVDPLYFFLPKKITSCLFAASTCGCKLAPPRPQAQGKRFLFIYVPYHPPLPFLLPFIKQRNNMDAVLLEASPSYKLLQGFKFAQTSVHFHILAFQLLEWLKLNLESSLDWKVPFCYN